jgi:hypothetical protein
MACAALLAAMQITAVQPMAWTASADTTGASPTLTLVDDSGGLWALQDASEWVLLAEDLGRGMEITAMAWHPTQPELLLVRSAFADGESAVGPRHELIRYDLATATETVIAVAAPGVRYAAIDYFGLGEDAWNAVRVECGRARLTAQVAEDQLSFYDEGMEAECRAAAARGSDGPPVISSTSIVFPQDDALFSFAGLSDAEMRARADAVTRPLQAYRIKIQVPARDHSLMFLVGQSEDDLALARFAFQPPRLEPVPNHTEVQLSRVAKGADDGAVAVGAVPPPDFERGHAAVLLLGSQELELRDVTTDRFDRVTAFAWANAGVLDEAE